MNIDPRLKLDTNDQWIESGEQAATTGSRQLKPREASRQVHTVAPLAATQVNNCKEGDSSKDYIQAVRRN